MTTAKHKLNHHTLLVIAHPNKKSFSHTIASHIIDYYNSEWISYELLDLYDHQQWFLQLNETNRPLDDDLIEYMQSCVKRAHEIIFCFPLRRFDCPAILKNRMEVNLTAWFAYRYLPGKLFPKKLLTDKQVRVFITAWWPTWAYYIIWWFIALLWYIGRINYVGMKLKSWVLFPDMNYYKTPKSRQWMIEKVKKIIKVS